MQAPRSGRNVVPSAFDLLLEMFRIPDIEPQVVHEGRWGETNEPPETAGRFTVPWAATTFLKYFVTFFSSISVTIPDISNPIARGVLRSMIRIITAPFLLLRAGAPRVEICHGSHHFLKIKPLDPCILQAADAPSSGISRVILPKLPFLKSPSTMRDTRI